MASKIYSSEGFILARKNYGEADRMLRIYSKDFGKVIVLAKGVRKLKSRKRGSVEIFSHIQFSAAHTNSMDILNEALPVNLYTHLRKNLQKAALAYYFMEIIDKITEQGEKNERLFEYLVEFMKKAENSQKLKSLRLEFVYKVLVILGYWVSGKELQNADHVLSQVLERKINSARVGKAMLS